MHLGVPQMHQGEHLLLAESSMASVMTPSLHPQFQCCEQPGGRWLSEGGSSPPAPEAEVELGGPRADRR